MRLLLSVDIVVRVSVGSLFTGLIIGIFCVIIALLGGVVWSVGGATVTSLITWISETGPSTT